MPIPAMPDTAIRARPPAMAAPRRSRLSRRAGLGGGAGGGGGSGFLGTAAAAAVGAIGGSLMMNSIRGLMGGNHQSLADAGSLGGGLKNPWSSDQSNSNLARDAGLNDVGKSGNDDARQAVLDKQQDAEQDAEDDKNDRDNYASNDYGNDDDDDHRIRFRRRRRQRLRPDRRRLTSNKRPLVRAAAVIFGCDFSAARQITMTRAPTLTRP